ncbi:hypothetical protein ACS0TY_031263 [Phlomoides rotata]
MDEESWITPIIEYLTKGTHPQDLTKASRLRIHLARYTIINDQLYKRGFSLPLLKCLTKEQGRAVLQEIHSGICDNHTGGHSLALKTIRQWYLLHSY